MPPIQRAARPLAPRFAPRSVRRSASSRAAGLALGLVLAALGAGRAGAQDAGAPSAPQVAPAPQSAPAPQAVVVPAVPHPVVPQPPSPACRRARAELAAVRDGASVTRALQDEIGRLQSYFRSLNCESGTFLFFDTRPPQCGAVEQRIRALNATYGGAVADDTGARRRELLGQVASLCRDAARAGLPLNGLPETAAGGPQVICVRTCDGGYFPMRNLPEGRGGADEMCQALCPGAEAVAYSMPFGDDALKHAASVRGAKAYVSLANAFRFRKAFVPNCSCKPNGQSWAQSLVKAESMLVRHKGDIFVTPMQAEALSRPKIRLTLVGRADKTAAELAADAAGRLDPARGAGAPAASAAPAPDGTGAPIPAPLAERTAVRVIAPEVVAVPKGLAP